ncbi:MAG: DUF883 family protein [Sulfitobacter sp.]
MARTSVNGSNAEPNLADLREQIDALRQDLHGLTGTIAEIGKAKGDKLSEAANQQYEAARQKGSEAADYARARARDVEHQARDFVNEQPTMALGIAAGAGFLVGMLSTRR